MAARFPEEQTVCDDKIFIQGVGPMTPDEELRKHLEKITGQKPKNIIPGTSQDGVYIATFECCVDVSSLESKQTTLDNYQLHIDRVPISNSINVSRLPQRLTPSNLEKYFNQITGGSKIDRIEFKKENGTAILDFENGIDVEAICGQHKIDKYTIQVDVHYKQLEDRDEECEAGKVEMYDFSDQRFHFLQNRDITQYVKQKMELKNLNGRWKKENGKLRAYANNDEDAADICHILKKSIVETTENLTQESMTLIESDTWEERKAHIKATVKYTVEFQLNKQKPALIVYSTDTDAGIVKEIVQQYLSENTVMTTQLQSSVGTMRKLKESNQRILNQIETDLKDEKVGIELSSKALTITGTSLGVSKAKRKIEQLIKPQEWTSPYNPSDVKDPVVELASAKAGQYKVTVMVGDITEMSVDAIVNTSNINLEHLGGLAKTLVQKGGKTIQDECDRHVRNGELQISDIFCSGPGTLKCKIIIHTYVPVWQDGRQNEAENLRDAIMKSLEAACNYNFTSVALPAVGAGVNGAPVNISTRTVVEAVRDFFKEREMEGEYSSLKDVYLCDINSDTAYSFIDNLKKFYKKHEITEINRQPLNQTWTSLEQSIIPGQQSVQRSTSRRDRFHIEDEKNLDAVSKRRPSDASNNTSSLPIPWYSPSLLKNGGYIEQLKKNHPKLSIKVNGDRVGFDGHTSFVDKAKSDLKTYLQLIKSKTGRISDEQECCLQNSQVKTELSRILKSKGVSNVVWEAKQKTLSVFSLDDQSLATSFSILLGIVVETVVNVTKENVDLIKSQEWHSHVTRIENHVQSYVKIDLHENRTAQPSLIVVTLTKDAAVVMELVQQVILEHTIHSKKIDIPKTTVQFLKDQKRKGNLKQIERDWNIEIDIDHMKIKGSEIQLEKGKKILQELVGKQNLRLSTDGKGPSSSSVYSLSKGNAQSVAEVKKFKYNSFTIFLMEGDITDLSVDVIVNVANKKLTSESGLRRAIVEKAGHHIEQQLKERMQRLGDCNEGELVFTSSGNLQVSLIIHAVCPSWQGGNVQEKELLNETIQRCFEKANSEAFQSIALPVMGTGVCGIKDRVAVCSILDAIENFYACTPQPYVTEVYMCCKLREHVDMFQTQIPKHTKLTALVGSPASQTSSGGHATNNTSADGLNWKNRAIRVALTRDNGFLVLLKQPAAFKYLETTIKATVRGKFDIEITNHVEIYAESRNSASAIESVLNDVIVTHRLPTKKPQKWRESIETFRYSACNAGKFVAEFSNDAIDCYGTRDTITSDKFKELSKTITDNGYCTIL